MGRQIIKKDDGTYAIWSTIIDDFIMDYASKEEVIEFLKEKALRDFETEVVEIFQRIETHQRRTYEYLLELRNEVHGDNYEDGFDES